MKKYEEYKPTELPWLSEIPVHWDWLYLSQVCAEQKIRNSQSLEGNVLSLSYGNIIRKKNINSGLTPKDFATYQIIDRDNIILRLTDLQNDHRSLRTGYVSEKGIITSTYVCLYPSINSKYLHYVLHSFDAKKIFYGMGSGVRQSMGFKDIRQLRIPIPSSIEQEQIVKFLDWKISKINKYIRAKKRQIELLKELKQAEINRAVTKGLDPNVPMKDSGIDWIGETPDMWLITGLKHCIEQTQSGVWGDDPKSNENDIICIRIADFDYFNLTIKNKVDYTVRNYKSKQHRDLILKKGDILIEKSGGGDKTPVGRAVRYNQTDIALYANFMEKVSLKNSVDSSYFVYFLSALYNKGVIWKYIKQTTGLQNLDIRQFFSSERVILPSFDIQIQIGKYLDTYSKDIYKVTTEIMRQISVLEEYKTSLISDVVTGKIDVRDIEVPENYETAETVREDFEAVTDDLENND